MDTSTPSQFVELYVPDAAPYLELFAGCLGYRLLRESDGWFDLRRGAEDRLILNSEDEAQLGAAHPFAGHHRAEQRGYGVELAVVVEDDLDALYARVSELGWRMEPVRLRAWGVRDFRVTTGDGFYIRVTERQSN